MTTQVFFISLYTAETVQVNFNLYKKIEFFSNFFQKFKEYTFIGYILSKFLFKFINEKSITNMHG